MIKFLRFLYLFMMVALPATMTVFLSKQAAIWAFENISSFSLDMTSTREIYFGLMLWFYVFFSLFLMIPKVFIYRKSMKDQPRKLKYDLMIYLGLPLLAFLFLPGERLVTFAFLVIMVAAMMEALVLYLPPFPSSTKPSR